MNELGNCLLVSTVFGTVLSLHPTSDFYTCNNIISVPVGDGVNSKTLKEVAKSGDAVAAKTAIMESKTPGTVINLQCVFTYIATFKT